MSILAHRLVPALGLLLATASVAVAAGTGDAERVESHHAAVEHRPAAAREPVACPTPPALREAFRRAADASRLPVALLASVAWVESRYRADAVSPAGARGVMQLMPETAALLDVDADDPRENVGGGARFLRQLVDRFRAMDVALAAYHAGPAAVAAAGGAPTAETVAYVANVNLRWRALRGCA